MASITIEVPDDLAAQYRVASPDQRRKLDALLSAQVRRVLGRPLRDLQETMDALAEEAKRNGLTEEILNEILSEKPA